MTVADRGGEQGRSAPASNDEQPLAAQVEIVMVAPSLELATQMLEGALANAERTLDRLPADASAAELRHAWPTSNQLLRLLVRPLVQRATSLAELSTRLAAAADLHFEWPV